jgi:hypothetical protein
VKADETRGQTAEAGRRSGQAGAFEVVAFTSSHLRHITPQAAQVSEVNSATTAAEYGQAWTALIGGVPIACAGLVEIWQGRAYAWALLAEGAGRYLLPVTREIRSRLDASGFARVEMAVDAGFIAGCRWAELLGFKLETPEPMRKYLPNGRDAYLYART